MDYDHAEQLVTTGFVSGITFDLLTEEDAEKISVKEIEVPNDVIHPMLGIPNPTSSQCLTCDAKDVKTCEGHFGFIKFPYTILHPYLISDVAKLLNKICVGCYSERRRAKSAGSPSTHKKHERCKYCDGRGKDEYPRTIFKVSSKEIFGTTAILAKISERDLLRTEAIASDYWNFLPKDAQQEGNALKPNERILSHLQVHGLLTNIDPKLVEEIGKYKKDLIFMNNFPVTPNCLRVNEFGQQMRFDERTRSYRKLVNFEGSANELSARVLDCLKMSKLRSEKVSTKGNSPMMFNQNEDAAPKLSGLKFIKELILGKRSDHTFRMVVVGDPGIKVDEIGVPCHVAEEMKISEQLFSQNWESLGLKNLTKRETYVRREGRLVRVTINDDKLRIGDTIHRPLRDRDIVLVNRPPSIHSHSLIALSVKILPTNSILSLNPLICSPFRGDFDGDCYHGYIPQSVDSRVELQELVALNKQLINIQNGQNLLSLTQDSLTAAQLVIEDGVLLNRSQMQQLQMLCPQSRPLQAPAIVKASARKNCSEFASSDTLWTGKQLFSLLLPQDFYYNCPSSAVQIMKGELITSRSTSSWLRDTKGNLFSSLVSHCQGKFLDFLHAAQGVLSEWLFMRGLSVSLADMYLSSDSHSRKDMIDEVSCGLREAEHISSVKLLMVDSNLDFLVGSPEGSATARDFGVEPMFCDRQKSAALIQVSVSAFKQVFRDIQNLFYRYASEDNSFLAMLKAGSKKSNLTRAVQHAMCLGLQHSLVPLSFKLPLELSCAAWNSQKELESLDLTDDNSYYFKSYIPYAVVQSSFLSGLNPLECFVHSLTTRDSSFGGHADISGTLTRRIMFFMRDLCMGYDGTVRSAYGNQVVQFSYNLSPTIKNIPDETVTYGACTTGGQPVGSWAACAISEAAYSALDLPISVLEASPLLNLKDILECGSNKVNNTASLFFSEKLRRWTHGFEYAALEVKSRLERLQFIDIVSTVMIMFSSKAGIEPHASPWVCQFHINKEMSKRKQIKVQSIIEALYVKCNSTLVKSKVHLPDLQITCNSDCSEKSIATICINIRMVGSNENCSTQLETLEETVIPFLLQTVIKGSSNVKKVDILWKDSSSVSNSHTGASGELYIRVLMSDTCDRSRFWTVLMNDCLQMMEMIDWKRSYPEVIQAATSVLGINFAKMIFISKLASAISDTGKAVLPEHLYLVADCLSSTGEFVALSANGLARQRKQTSVSSPFTQACFSSPADCFVNAGKMGTVDNLQGSLDSLAWGNSPSLGTGAQFDILYSGKDHEVSKPEDIYNLLGSQISAPGQKVKVSPKLLTDMSIKSLAKKGDLVRKDFKATHFLLMSKELRHILHKYKINQQLSELDESIVVAALFFHPRSSEKIGSGLKEIKIGWSSKSSTSRCFQLVRTDDTIEDFSYHKCIHNGLKLIASGSAKTYQSRWLSGRD
ncbi:DNA-directed RNA polymerase [Heracleum sosnowskyi]|uniref:DNA-directed RNA polymerase n=1 Tax=Heracleum sosnowskyi TaxID=360622 RepID=A0AAD8HWW7_9APIA|nr:DNA-directed RNA polymerase [Heracleum sosnowskyi]